MNSPIINSHRVQVDLGNMGTIKDAPVCVNAVLKREAMSTEEIAKLSFPLETRESLTTSECAEPSVISSSSSTASRESALSDVETNKGFSTPLLERHQSSQINKKVTGQKTSRNGRQTQRLHTDPESKIVHRMVAGCVPILEGGRVLFVSSGRKSEWILPKGGWENDEALEEGAIRECFEEAGVLGVLGPQLREINYETRKAKKRRLEFEEKTKTTTSSTTDTDKVSNEDKGGLKDDQMEKVKKTDIPAAPVQVIPDHTSLRIRRPAQANQSEETSSVASDSSLSHTHVRLKLFVLYVSDVKSSWPESGRKRKVVDIDEAIRMCESRPEFVAALKEVKERNLHHLPDHERAKGLPER